MASGHQVLENLRKQLAIAVRSIQWSYAIFWSISSRQAGVLEWGDGYYNGDIKTRKTVQAAELDADHLGLQRSEQLRELYESLLGAETNPQAKRPSAALSPEDLTDTEWYYLVCMSFIFNIGQGLPGRTLAKNQITWLSNAHQADSKAFSRSLLAKSASIQTVVCFPYLGGVVELGVTDLVAEDRDLVQHIKSTFLDNPYPKISEIPCYIPDSGRNDHNMTETDLDLLVEREDEKISSPNNSTSSFEDDQEAEESHMMECINGEASDLQGWQFMDDEISNCAHNSVNSSDCISQTYANPEKGVPLANEARQNNEDYLHELHARNQKKLNNFGFDGDDVHYQGVVSTLLKSSHQLVLGPCFRNDNKESGFVNWKKEWSRVFVPTNRSGKQQRLLKKILFEVPRRHSNSLQESSKDNGKRESICRPEADEIDNNHVLAERKRREKLNERFVMLGSLVPSKGKVDKISLLDNTIDYLKKLQIRVEELESTKETEKEARTRRRNQETKEGTSDNYFSNKLDKGRKPLISKRKASDVAEIEPETDHCLFSDEDLTVSVIDKNALIELKCPWAECVFLEILEAVRKLNLDSHTVQSVKAEGILSLTIKAKFKGSKVASPSMIRQVIQRIIRKNRISQ